MNNPYQTDTPAAISGRRKIRNDILFIASLLLVAISVGACIFWIRGEGDCVKVTVDGELWGTYSLSQDARIEIGTGKEDQHSNLLVIKDGKAYVESANCPDGICAEHRPISRDGESIVCLPHKVVITVYSSDDAPDVIV